MQSYAAIAKARMKTSVEIIQDNIHDDHIDTEMLYHGLRKAEHCPGNQSPNWGRSHTSIEKVQGNQMPKVQNKNKIKQNLNA